MLNIAICDGNIITVAQIEETLYWISDSEHISIDIDVFYSMVSLENIFSQVKKYDLLIIDIENQSGVDIVKKVRECDDNVIIVTVAASDKYMTELFGLDVFAYIMKPIIKETMVKLFLDINKKIGNKLFYFVFRYKNEEFKVPCRDIMYFESKGRKITIYLKDDSVSVFNGKLSEVENRLKDEKVPFLRIHQSFLVNYHMIKSRSKTYVKLLNGTQLPISEERRKKFSKRYGNILTQGTLY